MQAAYFLTLPLFFEPLFTSKTSEPARAKQGALPMDGPSEEDGQQTHYPPESEAVCCQVNGCANPVPTKVYYTASAESPRMTLTIQGPLASTLQPLAAVVAATLARWDVYVAQVANVGSSAWNLTRCMGRKPAATMVGPWGLTHHPGSVLAWC